MLGPLVVEDLIGRRCITPDHSGIRNPKAAAILLGGLYSMRHTPDYNPALVCLLAWYQKRQNLAGNRKAFGFLSGGCRRLKSFSFECFLRTPKETERGIRGICGVLNPCHCPMPLQTEASFSLRRRMRAPDLPCSTFGRVTKLTNNPVLNCT